MLADWLISEFTPGKLAQGVMVTIPPRAKRNGLDAYYACMLTIVKIFRSRAGDIGAVLGLKNPSPVIRFATTQTVILESISFPEPVILSRLNRKPMCRSG